MPRVDRRTCLLQRARRRDEAERRRLGRGGPSEAVITVEFAVELEQPIHRPPIALRHHDMRNDDRLADAGDLQHLGVICHTR